MTSGFWSFFSYGENCDWLVEANSVHEANRYAEDHCGADFSVHCECCGSKWNKATKIQPEYLSLQDALDNYFGKDATIETLEEKEDHYDLRDTVDFAVFYKDGTTTYFKEVG